MADGLLSRVGKAIKGGKIPKGFARLPSGRLVPVNELRTKDDVDFQLKLDAEEAKAKAAARKNLSDPNHDRRLFDQQMRTNRRNLGLPETGDLRHTDVVKAESEKADRERREDLGRNPVLRGIESAVGLFDSAVNSLDARTLSEEEQRRHERLWGKAEGGSPYGLRGLTTDSVARLTGTGEQLSYEKAIVDSPDATTLEKTGAVVNTGLRVLEIAGYIAGAGQAGSLATQAGASINKKLLQSKLAAKGLKATTEALDEALAIAKREVGPTRGSAAVSDLETQGGRGLAPERAPGIDVARPAQRDLATFRSEVEGSRVVYDSPSVRHGLRRAEELEGIVAEERKALDGFIRDVEGPDLSPSGKSRTVRRWLTDPEIEGEQDRIDMARFIPIARAVDAANLPDARKLDLLSYFSYNDITELKSVQALIRLAEENPKFKFRPEVNPYLQSSYERLTGESTAFDELAMNLESYGSGRSNLADLEGLPPRPPTEPKASAKQTPVVDEMDPAVYYDSILEDVEATWTKSEVEAFAEKHDIPLYRVQKRWADLNDVDYEDPEAFFKLLDLDEAPPARTTDEPAAIKSQTGDLRSTSHADTDEVREILDLPEREVSPEKVADWLDGAKKHAGHELQIAQDITANPRPITKTEGLALGRRLNELVRRMDEAKASGDVDAYDLARAEANQIADGLDAGGSEWGRSGRARQQLMAEDYSDFGVRRRASKAAGEGGVPAEVQAELDDLRLKLEDAEAKLAEHQAQAATAKMFRAQKGKRLRRTDDIAKDIEAVKKELLAAASKMSANPFVDPEIWNAFGKLVKLEIEAGASKLEDLVARLLKHAADAGIQATESDVRRVLAGLDKPERVPKNVKAAQVQLRNMKREAALIEELNKAEAGGSTKARRRSGGEATPEVRKLEDELAELQAKRRAQEALDQATDQRLAREQAERRRLLEREDVRRVKAEQRTILRQRKALEAQRARDRALLTPEQKKINRSNAYKQDLEEQIADMQQQLETGELKEKIRIKREHDTQTDNLLYERELLQRTIDEKIETLKLSRGQKFRRGLGRFGENVRGTILGSDFGILLRQGLFSIGRPKAYGKGLRAAFRAGFSDPQLAAIERDLDMRQIDGKLVRNIEKEAGLSRTQSHRTLNEQEELVLARLVKQLPEWAASSLEKFGADKAAAGVRKAGDATVGALLRGQHAFINTVRAETFDQAVRAGFDAAELKLRAQFINNATGRGNIKQVPKVMSAIFTSPRYEASRWAMLYEPLKNIGVAGADLATGKGLNRAALANLQDMGVTVASVYTLFKTAELAGYSVNWNPTDADFLKMRRGDETWDVSAGLAPRLRDLMRLGAYWWDPNYQHNLGDLGGRAFVRAISPAIKTPIDEGSKVVQKLRGDARIEGALTGIKAEDDETGWVAFMPLIMQSFYKNLEAEGLGSALGAGAREFVGTSVNRYAERTPKQAKKKSSPTSIGLPNRGRKRKLGL